MQENHPDEINQVVNTGANAASLKALSFSFPEINKQRRQKCKVGNGSYHKGQRRKPSKRLCSPKATKTENDEPCYQHNRSIDDTEAGTPYSA